MSGKYQCIWKPITVRWVYSGEHLDRDKSREKAKMTLLWEDTKGGSPSGEGIGSCIPELDNKYWPSYLKNF
jgi:hypothetical protein